MKYRIAGILLISLSLLYFFTSYSGFLLFPDSVFVERVVDGDTLVLEGGERVRLLGIDTPEKGQHLFKESTDFLRNLTGKRTVILEKDVSERDKYGRLLRYVHLGDVFVNVELVKRGYASVLLIEPDTKYKEFLLKEESQARKEGKGIWPFPEGDFCMSIFSFHQNAAGNDNENLNDEYVVFRNKCIEPVPLENWRVMDKANNTFVFPDFFIENKTTVTLHTGSGKDNQTDLFWGKSRAVWNNDGDILLLLDPLRRAILNHSYP